MSSIVECAQNLHQQQKGFLHDLGGVEDVGNLLQQHNINIIV
jgi:hypothetical protein